MANESISNEQVSLLAKGLEFVSIPTTSNEQILKKKIIKTLEKFERRMRFRYLLIFAAFVDYGTQREHRQ